MLVQKAEEHKHRGLNEVPMPSSVYPLLKGEVVLNSSKKAKSLDDPANTISKVKTQRHDAILKIIKQPFYT